jgi:tRNA(Ile)-lysidine synthase
MSVTGANETGAKNLQALIAGHFSLNPPTRLGVAVSGGSDSLALLVLLHGMRRTGGPELFAVTVDHGLRKESAAEATQVARICAGLNVPHETLNWTGWDGQGNLPDQARRARYSMMAKWAQEHSIGDIAVGHTANDQAETFLMRLGREAGVDGLSAMARSWRTGGTVFHRPLLQARREALRGILREKGLGWVEDPSNEDTAYARVRARQALAALEPLGITIAGLSSVAQHMSDVRHLLYTLVLQAAQDFVRVQAGDLLIDRVGFDALPPEISRRLLQAALKWVSGAEYAPRGRAMKGLVQAIAAGRDMTLSGCLIMPACDQLRVTREYNAVADLQCHGGDLWDGRWQVMGSIDADATIAALGKEGLKQCPDWRETGLPQASLMALPALWRGEELLVAPLAAKGTDEKFVLKHDLDHFFTTILSVDDVPLSH